MGWFHDPDELLVPVYSINSDAVAELKFDFVSANATSNSVSIVNVVGQILSAIGAALLGALFDRDEEEVLSTIRLATIEEQEKEFHEFVREQIICLLLFITTYLIAFYIISRYRARPDNDSLYAGDEDYFVHRISMWMCSVSLAISLGSIALLPFSVLGSELLQRYPGNYYLQWLTWSLIHSLWNYVFALSNLSLFVLLPFSYFFIESQGFSKKSSGIMQRVYETLACCFLSSFVILCLVDVVLALFSSSVSLISITSLNLPLIYSCVSLCGVLLLLISTPLGFAKIFSLIGESATKPIADVDVTIERLERQSQAIKAQKTMMANLEIPLYTRDEIFDSDLRKRLPTFGPLRKFNSFSTLSSPVDACLFAAGDAALSSANSFDAVNDVCEKSEEKDVWRLRELGRVVTSKFTFDTKSASIFWVPLREKSLRWYERVMYSIKYPTIVVSLIVLTGVALLMVVINSLKLFLGYRALPVYVQYMEVHTRHTFGLFGVAVEIIIILYVMATSLIGFYSLPVIGALRPRRKNTSMTATIINCSLILVLSSALPVLASTLGMTTFDLLGSYSALEWLRNFSLVIAYNIVFAVATVISLGTQITEPMRREILRRIRQLRCGIQKSVEKTE